jgi:galactose mutarotase-like enzyme
MPWGAAAFTMLFRKTSSAKYQTCFEPQRSANNSPNGSDETNSLSRSVAPGFTLSLWVSFSVPAKSSRARGPGAPRTR